MAHDRISPDGRFRIVEVSTPSTGNDHFYGDTDIEWALIDARTNRTVRTFYGRWDRPSGICRFQFTPTGRENLAKNKRGKILERVDIEDLARKLDKKKARPKKKAPAKKKSKPKNR